jgi:OOP family OmpA-OmpF porin
VRRISLLGSSALATIIGLTVPALAGEPDLDDIERRVVEVTPRVAEVPSRIERLTDGVPTQRTEESSEQVEISVSSDVLFEFDRADLTPAAQALLTDVAARINEEAAGPVQLRGHTDSIGDDAYNQALSEQRAGAVHTALLQLVGRDDITYEVAGFGETQPVAPNENPDGSDNPAGRQQNRRVTITFPKNGG